MPALVLKNGDGTGRRFELAGEVLIGRAKGVAVPIRGTTVSSRHASVTVTEEGVFIIDLQSTNGTFVNGKRISGRTRLRSGDELQIGEVGLAFEDASESTASSAVLFDESLAKVVHGIDAQDPWLTISRGGPRKGSAELDRRLQLLYDVSLALHAALDEKALLELILSKLLEVFSAADRGFVLLREAGHEDLVTAAVVRRSGGTSQVVVSRTLLRDVVLHRRGVVSADVGSGDPGDGYKSARLSGIRSLICVPMIADDAVLGVLGLDSLTVPRAFGEGDMALFVGIAAQAAMALAKTRLHEQLVGRELLAKDLALARKIQLRLLPREEPDCAGWQFRARYDPAQEVGGDYYDFVELPGGRVGVAIGDVSGKGISAALYMVRVLAEIRHRWAAQQEPRAVLQRLNDAVCADIEEGMFVTSTIVVVDPGAGRVRVAGAGHFAPLIRRCDGSVVEIHLPKVPPLGVNPSAVFTEREFVLRPGDTAVLYTDGIPEATGRNGEAFGVERFVDAISASRASPGEVLHSVLDAVRGFGADPAHLDDVTLVCFGPLADESTNVPVVRSRALTSGSQQSAARRR